MKPIPVLFVMFLVAGSAVYADAQSADPKQGKGNTKNDEYMTNEFYKTKPLTTDSKVAKGSGKASRHHIERIKAGKHNGPGTTVSADAMPEPKRSSLQNGSTTTDHSSDASGKRVHKPLTTAHKRK